MYEEFFNLKEKPFNLTPSERYLYLSDGHKEALSLLSYGVVERKGFVLLTGDVGTGKTTVIQALLRNLDKSVEYVHISNPLLTRDEFIDYVAFSTFKKRIHFRSKTDFLVEFEEYLKECLQHQKIFILIIDEAQSLSFQLIEEIRLLSNMEASEEKLINIFLVGQPELNEKLRNPICKPVYQRISNRYHLPPLDLAATSEYMSFRLKVAGVDKIDKIFSKKAVETIYECTQGIPRMINILADNALLLGYSTGKKKISPEMILTSFGDMKLEMPDAEKNTDEKEENQSYVLQNGRTGPPKKSKTRRGWKWAALFFLILVGLLLFDPRLRGFLNETGKDFQIKTGGFAEKNNTANEDNLNSENTDATPSKDALKNTPTTEKPGKTVFAVAETKQGSKTADLIEDLKTDIPPAPKPEEIQPPPQPAKDIEVEDDDVEQGLVKEDILPESVETITRSAAVSDQSTWKSVQVKEGDYLAKLALNHYGRADRDILKLIQENNPTIRNINWIDVGQTIVFPPLTEDPLVGSFTIHVASYKPLNKAQEKFHSLLDKNYEVYIIPVNIPSRGTLYRITIGNFNSKALAEDHAAKLLDNPEFEYAKVVAIEMN